MGANKNTLLTLVVFFLFQSPKGCFLDRCSLRLRRSCWLEHWLRGPKLWMCRPLFPPHLITTRKSSGQYTDAENWDYS